MKSLKTKLYEYTLHECPLHECPLNEGFYKNAGGMVCPTTVDELRREIKTRLSQGQYNLNDIDTSKITDMSSLFYHVFQRRAIKNIDVSLWDTSNVTSMSYMFFGCSNFDCDLSDWNTKNILYSVGMFINSGIKEKPSWYKVRGTRR